MNTQNAKYSFNIVMVRYLRDGQPKGMEYTYKTQEYVHGGQTLWVQARGKHLPALVTEVITPDNFAEYDESIAKMAKNGFTLDKVTEITHEDLVITEEKLEAEAKAEEAEKNE